MTKVLILCIASLQSPRPCVSWVGQPPPQGCPPLVGPPSASPLPPTPPSARYCPILPNDTASQSKKEREKESERLCGALYRLCAYLSVCCPPPPSVLLRSYKGRVLFNTSVSLVSDGTSCVISSY